MGAELRPGKVWVRNSASNKFHVFCSAGSACTASRPSSPRPLEGATTRRENQEQLQQPGDHLEVLQLHLLLDNSGGTPLQLLLDNQEDSTATTRLLRGVSLQQLGDYPDVLQLLLLLGCSEVFHCNN